MDKKDITDIAFILSRRALMKRIAISILIVSLFGLFIDAMQKPDAARMSLEERKKLFANAQERASQSQAQPQAQAASRKFEFSNQSDQYVTVWIPKAQGCWHPTQLYPYQDSGILNPIERGTIYIYTKATGHFIMQMGEHGSYRLINETPSEVKGHSKTVTIKHMPYDQVRDVVVVISPDGSVNFSKRNP